MTTLAIQKDNIKLAVLSILLAVLVLTLGDAVIKMLSVSFPLWQIYVIRSLLILPVLFLLVKMWGERASFRPLSIRWTVLRSALIGLMWVCYYTALPHIELSAAAAIYYTIPLFITIFSALFIGESISRMSWGAILIGFIGVLFIVKPTTNEFSLYLILPLIAAILYALAMILTRTKCVDENPRVLSLYLNLAFILIGMGATAFVGLVRPTAEQIALNPFLLSQWVAIDSRGFFALIVLALAVLVGTIFTAIAYQKGPPTLIATFDYTYLAFSALWGFLFFLEIPDSATILGMSLIVCAGLIALRQQSD